MTGAFCSPTSTSVGLAMKISKNQLLAIFMAKPTEVEVGEQKAPVIQPGHTFASLTEKIGGIVLKRPIKGGWVLGMFICFIILQWFLFAVCWLFYRGVGVWGVNIPIGWGFAIVNFVWWIGIGHAGTLISAILLLLRQS